MVVVPPEPYIINTPLKHTKGFLGSLDFSKKKDEKDDRKTFNKGQRTLQRWCKRFQTEQKSENRSSEWQLRGQMLPEVKIIRVLGENYAGAPITLFIIEISIPGY